MEKIFFVIAIALFPNLIVYGQTDTKHAMWVIVGGENCSYKKSLEYSFPSLIYSYDTATKTHDYSGNFDFDGDVIKDSLFFEGKGDTNLLFSLRIKLSSEHYQIRDFQWIASDLPALENYKYMKDNGVGKKFSPGFVVHDFDGSGIDEIYLYNTSTLPIPEEWRKQGVTSDLILVKYSDKNIVVKNFKKKWIR